MSKHTSLPPSLPFCVSLPPTVQRRLDKTVRVFVCSAMKFLHCCCFFCQGFYFILIKPVDKTKLQAVISNTSFFCVIFFVFLEQRFANVWISAAELRVFFCASCVLRSDARGANSSAVNRCVWRI